MTFLLLSFVSAAFAAFYFIALEKIPCTMLNGSCDNGHLENDNFSRTKQEDDTLPCALGVSPVSPSNRATWPCFHWFQDTVLSCVMACSRTCSRILGLSLGTTALFAAVANTLLLFPNWDVTYLLRGLIGRHAMLGSGLWGGGLMVSVQGSLSVNSQSVPQGWRNKVRVREGVS